MAGDMAPMQETFDYIVSGAGPGGCVLAARLTEDPAVKVLLVLSPESRPVLGLRADEPRPVEEGRQTGRARGRSQACAQIHRRTSFAR